MLNLFFYKFLKMEVWNYIQVKMHMEYFIGTYQLFSIFYFILNHLFLSIFNHFYSMYYLLLFLFIISYKNYHFHLNLASCNGLKIDVSFIVCFGHRSLSGRSQMLAESSCIHLFSFILNSMWFGNCFSSSYYSIH